MRPGDVVTCRECGASTVAGYTAPASWREGLPLFLAWGHGPYPRYDAFGGTPPALCPWCLDRSLGFPDYLSRPLPGEPPRTVVGPKLSYEIPPIPPVPSRTVAPPPAPEPVAEESPPPPPQLALF